MNKDQKELSVVCYDRQEPTPCESGVDNAGRNALVIREFREGVLRVLFLNHGATVIV